MCCSIFVLTEHSNKISSQCCKLRSEDLFHRSTASEVSLLNVGNWTHLEFSEENFVSKLTEFKLNTVSSKRGSLLSLLWTTKVFPLVSRVASVLEPRTASLWFLFYFVLLLMVVMRMPLSVTCQFVKTKQGHLYKGTKDGNKGKNCNRALCVGTGDLFWRLETLLSVWWNKKYCLWSTFLMKHSNKTTDQKSLPIPLPFYC